VRSIDMNWGNLCIRMVVKALAAAGRARPVLMVSAAGAR
jgi:hypothetical protein